MARNSLNKLKSLPPSVRRLRILFNEILEEMPEAKAQKLIDGYMKGKTIVMCIGESAYGEHCKTAFGSKLTEEQDWRNLPETDGMVN